MKARRRIERFLATDARDVGCDEAMEVLHVYAELLAEQPDAALNYPGLAAHFRACGPCAQDLDALLVALREDA